MRGETFSGISRCRQVGVTDVVDGSPHTSGGSLGPLAPHPHILVMFTSTCLNTNICCAVEAPQQEYLVYCNRMAGRMHRCRSLVFDQRWHERRENSAKDGQYCRQPLRCSMVSFAGWWYQRSGRRTQGCSCGVEALPAGACRALLA